RLTRVVEEPPAGLGAELVPRHLLVDQPGRAIALVAGRLSHERARPVEDVDAAQSMNSNTPTPAYRNPNQARIARSTSSGGATPSSTRRTASFMRTTWRRDTMKPGASPQRTGVLPRCVRNVIVRSTTAADVPAPGTTSTSGMTWAGFNQCATRNRSGPGTASARCLGEIVDDVEATIASSATRPVSRVKTSRLSSADSGS